VTIERLAAHFPLPIKYESRRRHLQRFLHLRSLTELIYISPSFECVWGYSCQELRQDFHNFFLNTIHPEDRARVKNATPKKFLG